eukprot:3256404-Pyramimonas_sp.AAC.1
MQDRIQRAMEHVCDTYGGPRQFLQQTFDTPDRRAAFYNNLMELLPPRQDIPYHDEKELEIIDPDGVADCTTPMALHPCILSFQNISSVKGHPERH